jgi:CBS domain containing-hemolysin-like protein
VVVVFVIAEAAPKTWAIQHTERAALFASRPVSALVHFAPLRLLSEALIGLTNVILPGKGIKGGPFTVSEQELLAYTTAAFEAEAIEAGEQELIESVLEFGDTVVREVMVPRTDMITVPSDLRIGDAVEVAILNGYSRIPVMGQSIDDIIGVAYAKDLMRAERDNEAERDIRSVLRAARFVPESKRVAELLPEMQAEKFHMAIVVDEYGGTAGLVTLEDLIEELVGEIVDEFDVEEPMVEPIAGGGVRVNARMPIDEVNELVDGTLPEGDWDSVGGLMFHLLGHVPVEGETAQCEGFELQAQRVQRRRIGRVRIVRRPEEAAAVEAESA